MARKGREPLVEAPPPAASSSEDEDEDSDEESSSGEEEEEEDEENNSPSTPPPPPTQPSSSKRPPIHKNPEPSKPTTQPHKPSDSDSDSDSDSPPAKVKPRSKPTTTATAVAALPAAVAGKRLASSGGGDLGSVKKAKREKSGPTQDEGKKLLFQRLWSEDDEIVILKGMIDYKAKKGTSPMTDADNFLKFIKKSLHVDVNRGQIVNKVRRLKKKFENTAKKKKITNPHELKAFELSKKIWGSDGEKDDDNNLNLKAMNVASKVRGSNSNKGVNGPVFEDRKGEEATNWAVLRCETEIGFGKGDKVGFLNEGLLKEGLKLLGEGERMDLAKKWRKHNMLEMEMNLKRLDLYRELTQKTLDALKSTEH